MMEDRVQEKGVAALSGAPVREGAALPLHGGLQRQQRPQPQEQVMRHEQQRVVQQGRSQVRKTQQQEQREKKRQQGDARQGRMTEGKAMEDQKQKKSVTPDSRQQLQHRLTETKQQRLSDMGSSELKGGRGGVGAKVKEDLFPPSLFAKGGDEFKQKRGGQERYHHGRGELGDEEEEEEQQFPSTVDSVASSAGSGNALGGPVTVAGFARRHTDCGTAASMTHFACSQASRSRSSTPLLACSCTNDTSPSIAAFCDDTTAPPLQLPLPAPLQKKEQLTTAGGDGTPASGTMGEGGERGVTAAVTVAAERGGAAGEKEEEDDGRSRTAVESKEKEGDPEEQENNTGSKTPGAGERVAGAGAAAAAEIEAAGRGREEQRGAEAAAAKVAAGEGDARGSAASARNDTGAQRSFRIQSRRKQSVTEQGRIAAVAVAAATRLFSRGDAASSTSSVDDQRQQQQQQPSVGLACGANGPPFSVAVAGPTSYRCPRLQQEQQRQQGGKVPQLEDGGSWRQQAEQQQEKRLLPLEGGEEQQQKRELRQQQRNEEEKHPERDKQTQGETSRTSAIEFLAAELQEEERKVLKAFCGEDDGEIHATEDASAVLLSPGDLLFSSRSSAEPGQQQPTQMDRWWGRSRSEEEQRSELVVSRSCMSSSSASLYSLLQQQQKNAPALLFSAAALQHDTSTKHSSLATLSPPKTSASAGFFTAAAAAAASRDIAVATATARQEAVPLRREQAAKHEEAGRGIGAGGNDEELTPHYAALFQRTEGETEISGLSPLPAASSGQDVVLSLMDLPRVLSLATQASPAPRAAFYPRQQQSAGVPFSRTPSSAAVAAQYASAAATLAAGDDAAAAARIASSLRAHLPPAASPEASGSAGHDNPFLRPDTAAAATAVATAEGVVGDSATPEECLPHDSAPAAARTDGGDSRTPSSPVQSLCLQAGVRPPPGFDAHAAEWPAQKVEHCNSNVSGVSTSAATTTSAPLVSTASPAAALLASASQESLAAAVAVLAAVAASPTVSVGSAAAGVPTEVPHGGESTAAAATAAACVRDRLFSGGDAFGVVAAAKTATGEDFVGSCSNDNPGAARTAPSSYSRGSSSLLPQREERSSPDSCRSGSPFDTASRHLLFAALTREGGATAAAGISRPAGLGGSGAAAGAGGAAGPALLPAAAAAARQAAALAVCAGEKQQSVHPSGGAGVGGVKVAGGISAGSIFGGDVGAGGRGVDRAVSIPSCQGGMRSISAGENENSAGGLLLAKQQQLLSLSKHRNSQQQQERAYVRRRGGTEAGGNGLRLFDSGPEARGTTERRAITEVRAVTVGRAAAAEGGRAAGGASSSFSAYGGRGVYNSGTPNGNSSGSRQTWLRKGEYLELLQQQQQLQHGGNGRSTYSRGQGERNGRRATPAAAREKAAQETKKDGFKVFFGNASALTTEEEMYGLFRQFGECSELILLRDRRQRLRGAGFVTFKNAADAMRAIEGLDRKYTVLGGTKPLEVRIPEDSEQKRERIRALARMRAGNAQQQSQEQQQQHVQQEHVQQQQQQHGGQQQQQGHPQQQQQMGYSPRPPYAQQRYSLSHQYGGATRHPQHTTASQRHQFPQVQQHYTVVQQQPHAFYEQQMRGTPLQREQQQRGYYHEQQQRRRASLHRAQGYVLGSAGERAREEGRKEIFWRVADARLRDSANRSGGASPKQEKSENPAAAPVADPAAALEALLVAAAQQQTQQRQQDYRNRTLADNRVEGAQDLLAWVQEYTRREGRRGHAVFADQQQQQRQQQPHHLQQQKEDYSTASKLATSSLLHVPGSAAFCGDTRRAGSNPVDHAAPAGAAAAACELMEEQDFYREISPTHSQGCAPSFALSQALAAAFSTLPSGAAAATANGMVLERRSDSSETLGAGGAPWQEPLSGIDQKTDASYFARPTAADRGSRGNLLSRECTVDAFPSGSSLTAGDDAATADARLGNGALSSTCGEPRVEYVNAVANMLTSRSNCATSCAERGSPFDPQSWRAGAGRHGTSPCSLSQAPASGAASVLHSAAGGSPAAPSPFLASFAAVDESVPIDGDDHDRKDGAAVTTLSGLGGLRFSPSQHHDGGSSFPPDLLCAAGNVSESWIKKLSLLRETD